MSKEPRQIFSHIDRHDVHRTVSISEQDGRFEFLSGEDKVGSLAFRTPKRDLGVTPEAVIAAVEDHLQAFDPTRGETKLAVDALEQARKFLAAGRDFAKIVKREVGGRLEADAPKLVNKPKESKEAPKPSSNKGNK